MKCHKTMILVLMTMFSFSTSTFSQVETQVTQSFNIRGTGWKKVLSYGTPVTIFAYNYKEDIYSFGIYSDDYAGIIDLKINPFEIEKKQLKKLPNAQGKKAAQLLMDYYDKARTKAREKAFAGKYKTASTDLLVSGWGGNSVSKHEPITIVGYKEGRDNVGIIQYFAVIKNDDARIYHTLGSIDHIIDIPLSCLPSTDDPQVKAIIDKEKSRIVAERQEEERRLAEQRRADEQMRRTQELEYLKLMDPAYIEVKKMKMDSAGGIEVSIQFTNCSSRRVKYVYFTGYFFNAVGDKCRNEIGGSTVWKYTGVGPVSRIPDTPNNYGSHIKSFHSDPPFYSKTARKLILSSVTIEYMDGQKTVLSGSELEDRVDYDYDYSWFL